MHLVQWVAQLNSLGFKALLLHAGQSPKREHKLIKLFMMLDLPQQVQIAKRVGMAKDGFEKAREEMSNAFSECRYVHEYKELQISLGFLDKVARVTQEVCTTIIGA